jgi:LAO/AO transport system kinase
VVIETVGVGQSETDVAEAADTVAVVVQPGSGDALQFLKAGIMEVPDVLVVTKADLGHVASRAEHDLQAALGASGRERGPGRRGQLDRAGRGDRCARRGAGFASRWTRHAGGAGACPAAGALADFVAEHGSAGCARSAGAAPRCGGFRVATRRWMSRR